MLLQHLQYAGRATMRTCPVIKLMRIALFARVSLTMRHLTTDGYKGRATKCNQHSRRPRGNEPSCFRKALCHDSRIVLLCGCDSCCLWRIQGCALLRISRPRQPGSVRLQQNGMAPLNALRTDMAAMPILLNLRCPGQSPKPPFHRLAAT